MESVNNYEASCVDCIFYNDKTCTCTNPNGKMKGIKLTESLAYAEHDCSEYEEVRYILSPKGIFTATLLLNKKVQIDNETINELWEEFSTTMIKHGYAPAEDEIKENE